MSEGSGARSQREEERVGELEGSRTEAPPLRTLLWMLLGVLSVAVPFALLRDPFAGMPKFGFVPPEVQQYGIPAAAAFPSPLVPQRAEGELRMFVVGASMTFGLPYQPSGNSSYASFLSYGLRAAWDRKDVHVRPDAYPAVDSPQLAGMAERCLRYGASHLLLVLGTNEFINRVGHGRALRADSIAGRVGQELGASQQAWAWLGSQLRPHLPPQLRGERVIGPDEPQGENDGFMQALKAAAPGKPAVGGLPVGDADRELLMQRMRDALLHVVRVAKELDVELCFALAPHAHAISPPWLSGLHADERTRRELDPLVAQQLANPNPTRIAELTSLVDRHPERADLRQVRGLLNLRLGAGKAAQADFEMALDLDQAPLHRTSRVLATVRQVAQEHEIRVLDLNGAFADEHGVVDGSYFLDYSHLNLAGQQRLARWLAGQLCGSFLPDLAGRLSQEDALEAFDAAVAKHAETCATPESRRLAAPRLAFNNGNYYRYVGNFREALPFLERAAQGMPRADVLEALELCRAGLRAAQEERR